MISPAHLYEVLTTAHAFASDAQHGRGSDSYYETLRGLLFEFTEGAGLYVVGCNAMKMVRLRCNIEHGNAACRFVMPPGDVSELCGRLMALQHTKAPPVGIFTDGHTLAMDPLPDGGFISAHWQTAKPYPDPANVFPETFDFPKQVPYNAAALLDVLAYLKPFGDSEANNRVDVFTNQKGPTLLRMRCGGHPVVDEAEAVLMPLKGET